ncbi:TolB-like translocation protein [Streptacidiphilus rugosus]|uniref:PD40 domain-containing protein n=1 Tax=Streptacidiphilus rugosus TaxID=405783 RepID=UPI000564E7A3|nr:PD40 domain-containing protein [Streptacidiphilus rugosus]
MSVRRRSFIAVAVAVAATAAALAPTLAVAAPARSAGPPVGPRTGLTISNGSPWVLENGSWVDFHTDVRDLAWNPTGTKAVFVDGRGDLDVAGPDGRGRVVVAKNPGGQTWSHPTWVVPPAHYGDPAAKAQLIFVAAKHGVTRLESVPATGRLSTPTAVPLSGNFGGPDVPQTGNVWPNAARGGGEIVYDNPHTGEVYIHDDYLRQQGDAMFRGSEPALLSTPGEFEVVFVRSVAGRDHLFENSWTAATGKEVLRDLTPHTTVDCTEPAFSPDGRTIAFRTPNGVYTMGDRGSSGPVRFSTFKGLPAYRA